MSKFKNKNKNKNKVVKVVEETKVELTSLSKKEQKIIEVFNYLCQTFDNGKGQKEANLLEILKDFNPIYVNNVGVIVPSVKETRMVCSSHIDLISKFQKGFEKEKKFKLVEEKGVPSVVGALDNTITNAILVLAIARLRKKGLAEDVEFVFTEGEETDMHGMDNYMKEKGTIPFYVNLDVTNDNIDFAGSVEYDRPSWEICKQLTKLNAGFTTERVDDDLDVVMKRNGRGFSYCLPTFHLIHSYENSTPINKLAPYMDGLEFLLSCLDVSVSESNFKYLKISKAMKCDTLEEMLEKEAKKKAKEDAKPKYTSSWSGYSKHSTSSSWSDYHGKTIFDYQEAWEEKVPFEITPKEKYEISESVSFILNSIKEYNPSFMITESCIKFLYRAYLNESFSIEDFEAEFGFNPLKESTLNLIIFKEGTNGFKFEKSKNSYVSELEELEKLDIYFEKHQLNFSEECKSLVYSLARSGFPFEKTVVADAIKYSNNITDEYYSTLNNIEMLFSDLVSNSVLLRVKENSFIFNIPNATFDIKTDFELDIDYFSIKEDEVFYLTGKKLELSKTIFKIVKDFMPSNVRPLEHTKDFIESTILASKSFPEIEFIYALNKDILDSGQSFTSYSFFNEMISSMIKIGLVSKLGKEHFLFRKDFKVIVDEDIDFTITELKDSHEQNLSGFLSTIEDYGVFALDDYLDFVVDKYVSKTPFTIKEMDEVLKKVLDINEIKLSKKNKDKSLFKMYLSFLAEFGVDTDFVEEDEEMYSVSYGL